MSRIVPYRPTSDASAMVEDVPQDTLECPRGGWRDGGHSDGDKPPTATRLQHKTATRDRVCIHFAAKIPAKILDGLRSSNISFQDSTRLDSEYPEVLDKLLNKHT